MRVPVDGSKFMPDGKPVAARMTVPPMPDGSVPLTVNSMLPPTVTFCGPGTIKVGSTLAETTVTIT